MEKNYVLDLRELGNSKGKGYTEITEVKVDDYIVHTDDQTLCSIGWFILPVSIHGNSKVK
jgi:hypothetical protein